MKKAVFVATLGLFLCFLLREAAAVDYITSTSCTASGSSACNVNGCFVCNGTAWVPQALIVGTASTCDTAHAGLLRYTASGFQGCDGTSWTSFSGGSSSSCSFTPSTGSQIFIATGTFTPPAGVSSTCPLLVRVLAVGGGGGGYTRTGGGSGYVTTASFALTATANIAVTVGTGVTDANGTASSFGSYLSASGGHGGDGIGNGGSGGGAQRYGLYTGGGGAGGSNGSNGGATTYSAGGSGQGSPIVSDATTVMGLAFQSATFSAGTGGTAGNTIDNATYGGYYYAAGGGGGGININGGGPTAGKGTGGTYGTGANGGTGYGAGGGAAAVAASPNGTGSYGVVYVEW